jgi:hypothetical protein
MRVCRSKRSDPTDGPIGQPATTVDPATAGPMHDAFRHPPANLPGFHQPPVEGRND